MRPFAIFFFTKWTIFFLDFLEFQTDSNDSIESYEAYKAKRKDSRSDSLGKEKARLRFKLIVCKSKQKKLLAMSLSCFANYVFKLKKNIKIFFEGPERVLVLYRYKLTFFYRFNFKQMIDWLDYYQNDWFRICYSSKKV